MAQISPFSLEFENELPTSSFAEMIRDYRRQVVSFNDMVASYYINRRGMEIEYEFQTTEPTRDEFPLGEAGDVIPSEFTTEVFEEIIANAKEATASKNPIMISFLIVMAANKQESTIILRSFNMYILNNELTK
ncbi:hypothetical protein SPFM12_00150 [Salmonella phage SPFM12]|nr:hypothetical protein SPFM12_00150 [Salmonella phage SPFM12]